jgi:hypothetical protein
MIPLDFTRGFAKKHKIFSHFRSEKAVSGRTKAGKIGA